MSSGERRTEDVFVDPVEETHDAFLSFRLGFFERLPFDHNGPHDPGSSEKAIV